MQNFESLDPNLKAEQLQQLSRDWRYHRAILRHPACPASLRKEISLAKAKRQENARFQPGEEFNTGSFEIFDAQAITETPIYSADGSGEGLKESGSVSVPAESQNIPAQGLMEAGFESAIAAGTVVPGRSEATDVTTLSGETTPTGIESPAGNTAVSPQVNGDPLGGGNGLEPAANSSESMLELKAKPELKTSENNPWEGTAQNSDFAPESIDHTIMREVIVEQTTPILQGGSDLDATVAKQDQPVIYQLEQTRMAPINVDVLEETMAAEQQFQSQASRLRKNHEMGESGKVPGAI